MRNLRIGVPSKGRLSELAVDLLKQRHAFDSTLWSYGIKHNVPEVIREYLQHADRWVGQCDP